MKNLIVLIAISLSCFGFSQKNDEIGVGIGFGSSNLGGSFTLDAKYNFPKQDEMHAYGLGFRWQRGWSKNVATGQRSTFNIWGPQAFYHYRFANVLFAGAEFELLNSPFKFTLLEETGNWIPCLFLGGGYSQSFDFVRINLGLFYDVIDNVNSPFRSQYFVKKKNENGQTVGLVPIIYKLSFFFPLGD